MRKQLAMALVCSVTFGMLVTSGYAADDEEPKYKTKDVMKAAFKGPLLKKVAKGDASEEETKQLYVMMMALAKNEPPRGEAESWKTLTVALVKASKAATEGNGDAPVMLKKASNCKACHSKHKP